MIESSFDSKNRTRFLVEEVACQFARRKNSTIDDRIDRKRMIDDRIRDTDCSDANKQCYCYCAENHEIKNDTTNCRLVDCF